MLIWSRILFNFWDRDTLLHAQHKTVQVPVPSHDPILVRFERRLIEYEMKTTFYIDKHLSSCNISKKSVKKDNENNLAKTTQTKWTDMPKFFKSQLIQLLSYVRESSHVMLILICPSSLWSLLLDVCTEQVCNCQIQLSAKLNVG